MPGGRPTIYNQELADEICLRIAEGESVRNIVRDERMPSGSSIFRWLLDEDKKSFWEQYSRARNIQAELMFEEILDIADDGTNDYMTVIKGKESYNVEDREVTNRSKLRVEARKWFLSKVLPKKFGDKLDMTSDGKALPTPLLNVIRHNQRNAEDTRPEEKD